MEEGTNIAELDVIQETPTAIRCTLYLALNPISKYLLILVFDPEILSF
jgi:hypothetical protein